MASTSNCWRRLLRLYSTASIATTCTARARINGKVQPARAVLEPGLAGTAYHRADAHVSVPRRRVAMVAAKLHRASHAETEIQRSLNRGIERQALTLNV